MGYNGVCMVHISYLVNKFQHDDTKCFKYVCESPKNHFLNKELKIGHSFFQYFTVWKSVESNFNLEPFITKHTVTNWLAAFMIFIERKISSWTGQQNKIKNANGLYKSYVGPTSYPKWLQKVR